MEEEIILESGFLLKIITGLISYTKKEERRELQYWKW